MRGYPKHLNTKQDVLNIMDNHLEFEEQLKIDLQRLLDEPDTVTKATTPIDPGDESKGGNTATIPNPNPRWKRIGFADKNEVINLMEDLNN